MTIDLDGSARRSRNSASSFRNLTSANTISAISTTSTVAELFVYINIEDATSTDTFAFAAAPDRSVTHFRIRPEHTTANSIYIYEHTVSLHCCCRVVNIDAKSKGKIRCDMHTHIPMATHI